MIMTKNKGNKKVTDKQGYLMIARSQMDHWLYSDTEKWGAFIKLLMLANFTRKKELMGGQVWDVPRGSFITSRSKLADVLGWKPGKVERFINLLLENNEVSKESSNLGTIITIVNYQQWQGFRQSDQTTRQTTSKAPGLGSSETSTIPSKHRATPSPQDLSRSAMAAAMSEAASKQQASSESSQMGLNTEVRSPLIKEESNNKNTSPSEKKQPISSANTLTHASGGSDALERSHPQPSHADPAGNNAENADDAYDKLDITHQGESPIDITNIDPKNRMSTVLEICVRFESYDDHDYLVDDGWPVTKHECHYQGCMDIEAKVETGQVSCPRGKWIVSYSPKSPETKRPIGAEHEFTEAEESKEKGDRHGRIDLRRYMAECSGCEHYQRGACNELIPKVGYHKALLPELAYDGICCPLGKWQDDEPESTLFEEAIQESTPQENTYEGDDMEDPPF
jgi:DNA replication protein DnaD